MKIKLLLLCLISFVSFAESDVDENGVYKESEAKIKEINIDVKKYETKYSTINQNSDMDNSYTISDNLSNGSELSEARLPMISLSKKIEQQTRSGMFLSIFGAYNDISGSYYEQKTTSGAPYDTKDLSSKENSNKFGGGALLGYKIVTPGYVGGYMGIEAGGMGFLNNTYSGNFIDAYNNTQTASHSLVAMGLVDMKIGLSLFETVAIYGIVGAGIPRTESKITGTTETNKTKTDIGLVYGGGVEVMFKYGAMFANVVKYYSNSRTVNSEFGISEHQDMFMVYSGFSVKLF